MPLPSSYVEAIDTQAFDTVERGDPTFLFGESFEGGRWYYFLALLAIKVPLPTWLLAGWALVASFVTGHGRRVEGLQVLLPSTLLLVAFSCADKQIGLRLVLPFVVAGLLWSAVHLARACSSARAKGVLGCLLAWLAFETASVHPNYLTYFNQTVGGPSRGHEYALGSNLDWGQDLIQLREFMREEQIEELRLLYYGRVDPALYGIDYVVPRRRLTPGLLAVSRTFRSRGYWVQDHGKKTHGAARWSSATRTRPSWWRRSATRSTCIA